MRDNYIYKIGVEIEGLYKSTPYIRVDKKTSKLFEIDADDSIKIYNSDKERHKNDIITSYEVRTIPIMDYEILFNIVKAIYPDDTNKSCGTHIHISFTNDYYYLLLTNDKFINLLIKNIKKFYKKIKEKYEYDAYLLKRRLKLKSDYVCEDINIDRQMKAIGKTGYLRNSIINYCKKQHNTIEFRFPPTFTTAELCIDIIKLIINTIVSYLNSYSKKSLLTIIEEN